MKLNYGEFDDFLNKKVKVMAKKLLVKDKSHVPMVISVSNKGLQTLDLNRMLDEVQVLDKKYGNNAYHAGKDMMAKIIIDFVDRTKAYAYVYVSECWYMKSAKDEPIDTNVRHNPDRDEALILTWEYDAYGVYKSGMTMLPFYRNEDDSILLLKEVSQDATKKTATGRFTNILKPLS